MRRIRGTGMALVLLGVAGCATGGHSPTAGTSPPTGTATRAVTALPTDQVVFRVRTGDGYWLRPRAPFEIPSVVVTGDGTVYASTRTTEFVTPVVVVSHRAASEVAELSSDLEADGLLAADFGSAGYTDLETTTVSVHGTGPALTASVYGLYFDEETTLRSDQIDRRDQLKDLISELEHLSTGTQEWVPDRVRVQHLWSDGPDIPESTYPTWTGPDPTTLSRNGGSNDGCAEVTTGAADLSASARTNPDAIWTTSEGPLRLAVVPLLPGETAC